MTVSSTRSGKRGTQTIRYRGRAVYTAHERYDRIPGGTPGPIPVAGGRPRTVASGLLSDDYRTWCSGMLVMTAGGDRIASHHKWLSVTGPPAWHARILVRDEAFAMNPRVCDDHTHAVSRSSSGTRGRYAASLRAVDAHGRLSLLRRRSITSR